MGSGGAASFAYALVRFIVFSTAWPRSAPTSAALGMAGGETTAGAASAVAAGVAVDPDAPPAGAGRDAG
eukprot:3833959-Alexandrium_andersonii.AAC.1